MKCIKCGNEDWLVRKKTGICLDCNITDIELRLSRLEELEK